MAKNWGKEKKTTEVTFEIVETLGVLSGPNDNGWSKEVNVVAWNGGVPKVEVREWDEKHERCGKGVRFTDEEAEALGKILVEAFK